MNWAFGMQASSVVWTVRSGIKGPVGTGRFGFMSRLRRIGHRRTSRRVPRPKTTRARRLCSTSRRDDGSNQGSHFAASNENSSLLSSSADYKRRFSSWRSLMNKFLFTSTLLLAVSLAALQAGAQKNPVDAEGHQWWQHAVFYEVYPRSFADSNNDGVGDLDGITSKLGYLHDLGVDAIWITPCYPSPQVDFGYDVSDYENIDPMYGTLADFDTL